MNGAAVIVEDSATHPERQVNVRLGWNNHLPYAVTQSVERKLHTNGSGAEGPSPRRGFWDHFGIGLGRLM